MDKKIAVSQRRNFSKMSHTFRRFLVRVSLVSVVKGNLRGFLEDYREFAKNKGFLQTTSFDGQKVRHGRDYWEPGGQQFLQKVEVGSTPNDPQVPAQVPASVQQGQGLENVQPENGQNGPNGHTEATPVQSAPVQATNGLTAPTVSTASTGPNDRQGLEATNGPTGSTDLRPVGHRGQGLEQGLETSATDSSSLYTSSSDSETDAPTYEGSMQESYGHRRHRRGHHGHHVSPSDDLRLSPSDSYGHRRHHRRVQESYGRHHVSPSDDLRLSPSDSYGHRRHRRHRRGVTETSESDHGAVSDSYGRRWRQRNKSDVTETSESASRRHTSRRSESDAESGSSDAEEEEEEEEEGRHTSKEEESSSSDEASKPRSLNKAEYDKDDKELTIQLVSGDNPQIRVPATINMHKTFHDSLKENGRNDHVDRKVQEKFTEEVLALALDAFTNTAKIAQKNESLKDAEFEYTITKRTGTPKTSKNIEDYMDKAYDDSKIHKKSALVFSRKITADSNVAKTMKSKSGKFTSSHVLLALSGPLDNFSPLVNARIGQEEIKEDTDPRKVAKFDEAIMKSGLTVKINLGKEGDWKIVIASPTVKINMDNVILELDEEALHEAERIAKKHGSASANYVTFSSSRISGARGASLLRRYPHLVKAYKAAGR